MSFKKLFTMFKFLYLLMILVISFIIIASSAYSSEVYIDQTIISKFTNQSYVSVDIELKSDYVFDYSRLDKEPKFRVLEIRGR